MGIAPWLVFAVLLTALIVAVVLATPWDPLAGASPPSADPGRDFSAAELAELDAHQARIRPPTYTGLAVGLAVTVLLGMTPLGARLVTAAARPLGGGWVWQVLLGGLAVLLVIRLATIGFSAWAEAVRRAAGLSTRSWLGWAADLAKSFGLQAAATLVALLAMIALARALPRSWWAFGAVAAGAAVVALAFAYPLIVEPVFNRFTPLPPGELRTSLLRMADRSGVPVDEILEADASKRTSTLNAYVSGLSATRRIVVFDTLTDRSPPAQVRSVVAHELGHAAEQDVRDGALLGALGAAAAVCLLGGLLRMPALLDRSGASGPDDPRIIALVLAVVAVAGLVSSPAQALVSRRVEARADVHALDVTADPQAFAEMQRSLVLAAKADPEPPAILFGLFASHPTGPQRIAMARAWADRQSADPVDDLAPVGGSAG
ncbi:MAG: M48 family metalloprotease [Jiangellaceae bacterium]|nr:M48 family metalloprotease [Jiangellaceae bacterium]